MGTWICHLRIAEKLLPHFPELDKILFTFGNLAPDSGIPNETWTVFDPPKEVTHFLQKGEGEDMIRDLVYYREYLAPLNPQDDIQLYSFRFGYFTHLICDILWMKYLGTTTKAAFQEMIATDPQKAWDRIKDDWYGLDQLYNRAHPENLFWQIIHKTPSPPSYLPFVNEKALHQQYNHIRKFYGEPDAEFFIERKFPYLNESTMTRIIEDTVNATLLIIEQLRQINIQKFQSSFEILPAELILPYPMPLGDP
ncbi:MAG: zinc dependent phospholipase C family protein [Anaerolineales bacterium]|uniref:zinc dependent phospholipase C family protein n=1 Tax=Candidatus Villigracilis proximus TaxID=3140683 RepID=UPI003136CF12|nr:zinc dependent phospholipase C family protein [Anaerolineales bacterium]